ncbi:MAG: DUF1579 domain-containing protein [Planctomycetota bacterium]
MKPGCTLAALALVIATAVVTSHAVSQEDPIQPPSEAEMMKRWAETMKVGTPHKWLAKLAGNWTTETTFWMGGPGSEPMKMNGTAEYGMILGGRFLETKTEGNFGGQPWSAVGLIGYDNFEKRFVSTWADSGGTGIAMLHGHGNRDGKTIRLYGAMNEPTMDMVGKYARFDWTLVDEDTLTITGYDLGLGEKAKVMEVVCKRVKASREVEDGEMK